MAKFKFEGIDEYVGTLEKLGKGATEKILKYAVYPGAGIVADAIRASGEKVISDEATGEMLDSLTLAPMRNDDGFINTKVMFAGYDSKGTPNAVKAAVLESGRSDNRQKATHFISKAVKSCESRAIQAMSDALDEKISEIMGD